MSAKGIKETFEMAKNPATLAQPASPLAGFAVAPAQVPQIPDHELIRCIGRGSYGEVWLARNVLGELRAVKIVYRNHFEHDRPFEREFEGIQKFEPISRAHPSQLNILHVGRNDDGGYFYHVMELADNAFSLSENAPAAEAVKQSKEIPPAGSGSGTQTFDPQYYLPRTLASDLKARGRLPFDECLRVALALTTALEHLHSHGLIHRDIKPANVIFVNGMPKLADIGLVASVDATCSFVGTEGYLPPEGPGSPQADL